MWSGLCMEVGKSWFLRMLCTTRQRNETKNDKPSPVRLFFLLSCGWLFGFFLGGGAGRREADTRALTDCIPPNKPPAPSYTQHSMTKWRRLLFSSSLLAAVSCLSLLIVFIGLLVGMPACLPACLSFGLRQQGRDTQKSEGGPRASQLSMRRFFPSPRLAPQKKQNHYRC